MKSIVLLFALLAITFALNTDLSVSTSQEFIKFVAKYGKKYGSAEEVSKRLAIFKNNMEIAENLNKINPEARFGVTQFMDLSPEEFKSMYLISNFTSPKKQGLAYPKLETPSTSSSAALPGSFNWVSKGATTPVYNQEQCGSCWAFSTTENIESMWQLAGKGLHQLSMQQLVDCAGNGDEGCNGGNPIWTYPYIISNGGIDSYSSYPYTAQDGTCKFRKADVTATISNWGYVVDKFNAEKMMTWMYNNGPPSICVDASTWQTYQGGVIGKGCGQAIDHCVQLVGWETVEGVDAWIVRNSWGTSWGYSGFLYVNRGADYCAIGDEVTSSVI